MICGVCVYGCQSASPACNRSCGARRRPPGRGWPGLAGRSLDPDKPRAVAWPVHIDLVRGKRHQDSQTMDDTPSKPNALSRTISTPLNMTFSVIAGQVRPIKEHPFTGTTNMAEDLPFALLGVPASTPCLGPSWTTLSGLYLYDRGCNTCISR